MIKILEGCQINIEDYDEEDINNILQNYSELVKLKEEFNKNFDKLKEHMEDQIKKFLKERNWDSYNDSNSNVGVMLSKHKEEKIDEQAVKDLLTPNQYNNIIKTKTKETLTVITPEQRERLKSYVRVIKKKKTRKK